MSTYRRRLEILEARTGLGKELISEIRFIIYGGDGQLAGITSFPACGFPGKQIHRDLSELTPEEIAEHPPLRQATETTLRHSE